LRTSNHEVAIHDADLDHRVATDTQHEQVAVAGEVFRQREQLLDVLLREHVGAGGHIAHQGHVPHPPDDGSKRTSMARGFDGSRLR